MPKHKNRKVAETIPFLAPAPDISRVTKNLAALVVVQGAEPDLGAHAVCDRPIVIGRDPDVELPLRDGSISRRHCVVERDALSGEYSLRDLGSRNGTMINGTHIDGPARLAEGDKIFLGASVVRFSFADVFDVQYQVKVENLVATDPLTGLLTRRRFDAVFATVLQKARAEGSPLAVLMMDMDGLKGINDTHGHEMGSYAIVEVAKIVARVVGDTGEICRLGGDEFITCLPNTDKAGGIAVAERIRAGVAEHDFEKDGVIVAPTMSIGVAALPEDGDSTEELGRAADRALYRAKNAGRNRVCV